MDGMTNDDLTNADEPSAFDELKTPAEIVGYTFHLEGEEGLRGLLKMLLDTPLKGYNTREDWLDCAAELQSAGLSLAAAIVSEHAANLLPMDHLIHCPSTTHCPPN